MLSFNYGNHVVCNSPDWCCCCNSDFSTYQREYGEKMPEETLLLVEDYIDGNPMIDFHGLSIAR